ncbi:hypothetical protein ACQKM2_02280 [Streptomyces sp. NPDC004126]|uniref:hypothetical protein n=1 Tax=Streptomyces sp. NPDC004126 TaxID=3390695 RepID=UPI003D01382A
MQPAQFLGALRRGFPQLPHDLVEFGESRSRRPLPAAAGEPVRDPGPGLAPFLQPHREQFRNGPSRPDPAEGLLQEQAQFVRPFPQYLP